MEVGTKFVGTKICVLLHHSHTHSFFPFLPAAAAAVSPRRLEMMRSFTAIAFPLIRARAKRREGGRKRRVCGARPVIGAKLASFPLLFFLFFILVDELSFDNLAFSCLFLIPPTVAVLILRRLGKYNMLSLHSFSTLESQISSPESRRTKKSTIKEQASMHADIPRRIEKQRNQRGRTDGKMK
ncbi:uncharacterized protein IWZ02DRAFT_188970 [Phyllosticta citriasiana]|uniref:uncharacterized protein n=1 Tax=Phyllosticta citriasiana TaxID=595635 RepID=UPI0030FDB169